MSCLRTSGKGPSLSLLEDEMRVFVKVFRRKWYNERREGPFEVVRSTGTAVQVKGSPTWYHFSHCVKAPSDELPCSQSHDEGSKQSEGNAERSDPFAGR
uniref:Murine leukemia virus integrase C-terminal domain-containing protein n=1 Tax=Pygocentrus nattereri TaxID=42514 RepID=A0AAR2IQ00_PYGNA